MSYKGGYTVVESRYNELAMVPKILFVVAGLPYSEDPVIMNYLVNSKNIRYSGVI